MSPTEILAVAQDGQFLAWIARVPNAWDARRADVLIRSLVTGRERAFATKIGPTPGPLLALGRGRALWIGDPDICGNCFPARIYTAALGDPRVVRLGTFAYAGGQGGRQVTGLVADRRLLAFSWVRYELLEEPDCITQPVPCLWDVTGGRAVEMLGRKTHAVPGVGPPALLAAGAGLIAVAATDDPWEGWDLQPQPAEDGPVDVLDPQTGRPVMSVSPAGTARSLALSARGLAVLVERADRSLAIERYAIPSGALLASTPVDSRTAVDALDIAGKWVVYQVRRQIRIVGPLGGDHLLIEVPARPIDVSIEGRRVAWAENVGRLHRVRAVLAPR